MFLLALADLNDRQGLFSPAITNEPRHACIYAAKIYKFVLRLTLFLLALADLNDRQGLFSPAITNEPCYNSYLSRKMQFGLAKSKYEPSTWAQYSYRNKTFSKKQNAR